MLMTDLGKNFSELPCTPPDKISYENMFFRRDLCKGV